MGTLGASFALIFLAELGDKSMLLVFAVAARTRVAVLLPAVALSAAVIMGAAVVLGAAAGEILPRRLAEAASALLFVAVGLWTLRASFAGGEDGGGHGHELPGFLRRAGRTDSRRGALLLGAALAAALTVAELGDKTQLATISLAGADPGRAALIWAGAAAGMTAADAIAILAGVRLARLLPGPLLERAAGALFLLAGVVLAALAVR